jgi:AcrR family transcriptional regulator
MTFTAESPDPHITGQAESTGRVGRPRDEEREQAILDAAVELLAEVGYDRMSMDAVAGRARASKATIYRRWPGKAELVAAAMHGRVAPPPALLADTGSLRGDLVAAVSAMCRSLQGADGGLMCGLATAVRGDDDLARVLGSQLLDDKRAMLQPLMDRAVARGELPPGTDATVIIEVAPSVTLLRQLTAQPLDDVFVEHLVDDILLPLVTGDRRRGVAGGLPVPPPSQPEPPVRT